MLSISPALLFLTLMKRHLGMQFKYEECSSVCPQLKLWRRLFVGIRDHASKIFQTLLDDNLH